MWSMWSQSDAEHRRGPETVTNQRRSIWIDEELWAEIQRASAQAQLETGEHTTASEWIREKLRQAVALEL